VGCVYQIYNLQIIVGGGNIKYGDYRYRYVMDVLRGKLRFI
jgi:hypothetical protein